MVSDNASSLFFQQNRRSSEPSAVRPPIDVSRLSEQLISRSCLRPRSLLGSALIALLRTDSMRSAERRSSDVGRPSRRFEPRSSDCSATSA
jgi:hypothetical protein